MIDIPLQILRLVRDNIIRGYFFFILVMLDKTPTPTKLLQSIEEIGLFVDDDDIDVSNAKDRQKKVDALKDRLVENPFDEHFRKATQMQKEAAIFSGNESADKQVRKSLKFLGVLDELILKWSGFPLVLTNSLLMLIIL